MANKDSWIRRMDRTGVPLLMARLVLAGMFLYLGISKIDHASGFLKLIRQYDMVPESPGIFLNSMAIVIPWIEITCGIWILLGTYLRGAGLVAISMLGVFTPIILIRALSIRAAEGTPFMAIAFDCGCGAGVVVIWKKLLENTGLFLLSLIVLFSCSRRFCLDSLAKRRPASERSEQTGPEIQSTGDVPAEEVVP